MPSRSKANLSRNSRDALRFRLKRARETDEERSERLAAQRECQKRRYNKKKVMTQEPPISQVRIENVRTLRPGAHKRGSEKDWLKAVKSHMYSEKVWLATMKERLKSERVILQYMKHWLDCEKDVHCKPLKNSEMDPSDCDKNPCISERDPSKSEGDLSISVESGLNIAWLREKTRTAQDHESNELTINVEVLDTIKEEVLDTIKEEVLDTIKEEVLDTIKEEVLDTIKEEVLDD